MKIFHYDGFVITGPKTHVLIILLLIMQNCKLYLYLSHESTFHNNEQDSSASLIMFTMPELMLQRIIYTNIMQYEKPRSQSIVVKWINKKNKKQNSYEFYLEWWLHLCTLYNHFPFICIMYRMYTRILIPSKTFHNCSFFVFKRFYQINWWEKIFKEKTHIGSCS